MESADLDTVREGKKFSFDIIGLEEALKIQGNVVGIYIAQSPSWVPPHLNHYIDQLIMCSMLITKKKEFDIDDGVLIRKPMDFKAIDELKAHQR